MQIAGMYAPRKNVIRDLRTSGHSRADGVEQRVRKASVGANEIRAPLLEHVIAECRRVPQEARDVSVREPAEIDTSSPATASPKVLNMRPPRLDQGYQGRAADA
jgi:hypothetical protein